MFLQPKQKIHASNTTQYFLHYQPNHIYENSYKPRDYAN